MADTTLESSPIRVVVQYISQSKVDEAHDLASRGQQQLYDIAETERTEFRFPVSASEHFAQVEVAIQPVWETSRYPLFEPHVRYQPCCEFAAQDDSTDKKFTSNIQLVYDTYIRPTKRKFDDEGSSSRGSNTSSSTCAQKKRRYVQTNDQVTERANDPLPSRPSEGCEASPAKVTHRQLASKLTQQAPHSNVENDSGSSEVVESDSQNLGEGQGEEDNKVVKIANSVIKKVKKVIMEKEKKEKRRAKRTEPSDLSLEGICSRELSKPGFRCKSLEWVETFEQSATDGETSLRGLRTLENDFTKVWDSVRKHGVWTYWYYAASFSYIRYLFGKTQMDRRAKAVRVINRSFSHLWSSDGPAAVMLLYALAEKRYTLCDASYVSDQQQDKIITLIVKGLTGALKEPPEGAQIPFPVVWVSFFLKIGFQDACRALDLDALAEIELQPTWETCPDGQFELRQGHEYAFLKARWASLHANSGLLHCEQESSCSPELEVVEDGDRAYALQTTSQDVPSPNAPSQDVPSQAVAFQDVPSPNAPSQDVPSQDVLSAEFWLKGFQDNDIREMHFEDAFLSVLGSSEFA
ncbi:hypothetical protein LTR99_011075 [Exophiala xenobiotica]|uniref:Uncharacterized protein n=1 Tax=Vermiconidia calcicola TaxID=1690605 RepID=A0AAV9PTL3_9PEZI|nr:hypothetical protein LTR99_011075 [Exophiala xenobiotica]KAK5401650.1 hypothetical protein LTR06_011014 [Exophiala xenobiotica]KAK5527597.1 hypothetical protein LTR25_011046 [Vermiconidia calcicola]